MDRETRLWLTKTVWRWYEWSQWCYRCWLWCGVTRWGWESNNRCFLRWLRRLNRDDFKLDFRLAGKRHLRLGIVYIWCSWLLLFVDGRWWGRRDDDGVSAITMGSWSPHRKPGLLDRARPQKEGRDSLTSTTPLNGETDTTLSWLTIRLTEYQKLWFKQVLSNHLRFAERECYSTSWDNC